MAGAIVLVVLAAYWPAINAGYVWDDDVFLTANPLIRADDGLQRFWFTTQAPDYFPLTSSVLWLEWRAWGDNPLPYHLVNILLHAAGAILLWRVLAAARLPGAYLAGLIFAVHPVAAGSVAWITELKNTLPMAVWLSSVLAYLHFDRTGRRGGYILALGLFAAALLAKTSVVAGPVALLALLWYMRKGWQWRELWRLAPFFGLSAALGLVTVFFQHERAMGGNIIELGPLGGRILAAAGAVWFYLWKLVYPARLSMIYDFQRPDPSKVLSYLPLAALAMAAAVLAIGRRTWGRGPLAALLAYVAILGPVLGFVSMSFFQYSPVSDHLQYAAMPAIIALAAGLLAHLMGRIGTTQTGKILAVICLVGAMGYLTFKRAGDFKDRETLWRQTLQVNDQAYAAWGELAVYAKEPLETRLNYCQRALQLNPDYGEAWCNRAFLLNEMGKSRQAIADCDKALAIQPGMAQAFINRAKAKLELGRFKEAIEDCDRAIAINNSIAMAYIDRGTARQDMAQVQPGQAFQLHQQAEEDFSQAIRLQSDLYDAWCNRGISRLALGRPREALEDYNQAIRLHPDYANAYNNRANLSLLAGQFQQAIEDYTRALALRPDMAAAYHGRAACYMSLGQYELAWADVASCRRLGIEPASQLVGQLTEKSGRNH